MVDTNNKLAAEFFGTFLLVFTVGCNVLAGQAVWGGVSIACVLMVAIYSMGGISGANFNPAVSFALGMIHNLGNRDGGKKWEMVGQYCLVQILGGLLGGFCYINLYWDAFNLAPAAGFGWVEAGLCEMLYTFMLCFVVLNVACRKEKNQYYGLAIGFVIVAGAYGAGPISGGCFNPAVAIAIDTASAGLGFGWCFSYVVFEIIGAALAAFLYSVVRPEEFDKPKHEVPSKLLAEFLGTYMLVLTVGLNVLAKSPAAAFSIAASLMSMIYALGDVSGAMFNPAVSVAVLASGLVPDFKPKDLAMYIAVQLAGGVCAAFTYATIHKGESFGLGPVGNHGWQEVAIAEIVFTFVLCFVVLCAAVDEQTNSKDFFGLAIGSCVTVGGFAIGGVSGGSLNPAVSFGIASSHILGGGLVYKALYYSAFELIGGGLAAGVHKVTHNMHKKGNQ